MINWKEEVVGRQNVKAFYHKFWKKVSSLRQNLSEYKQKHSEQLCQLKR